MSNVKTRETKSILIFESTYITLFMSSYMLNTQVFSYITLLYVQLLYNTTSCRKSNSAETEQFIISAIIIILCLLYAFLRIKHKNHLTEKSLNKCISFMRSNDIVAASKLIAHIHRVGQ